MKAKIGEAAGKIWQTLKGKDQVNIEQLPRMLKEKSLIVYQALGWLAREGKVDYHTKGGKTFVALSDSERNI